MKKHILRIVFVLALVTPIVGLQSAAVMAAVDPGLELHWNLDEGTGNTANDDSGHSNSGDLFNGPSYTGGKDGFGVNLDGVSQYIQTGTPLASLGTQDQPYALSAWVKIPNGVTDGNIVHISSNADGSGWCIPFLRLQSGVFAATGWSAGATSVISPNPVAANRWYQVLTSWDPANGLRLFVDGTLVDQTPQATYDAAGAPIYFSVGLGNGACSEDRGFLNATVDDARVYSRALASTDIAAVNALGSPVVPVATSTPSSTQTAAAATVATTTAAKPQAPDTGQGTPGKPDLSATFLPAILLSAGGLLLLHNRRHGTTNKS